MKPNPPPKRAWITGAGGLIGSYIAAAKTPQSAPFEVVALSRPILDLTDFAAVERRFRAERPDLVIHCAAMSRTGECQANPDLARKMNVDVTSHLAGLAADADFMLFSTDLVFDGAKGNYVETDAVHPLSVYGETKVEAEQIVLKNPRHTIIRTSLNSGVSPRGLGPYNEQLQAAWKKGETVDLFLDEIRAPIPASLTARAVWELAAQRRPGLYHLAGSEPLSRFAIGQLIAAHHPELHPRLRSSSLREYKGHPRAANTFLVCAKIQKLLSFPLPGLTEYLRAHPEEPI